MVERKLKKALNGRQYHKSNPESIGDPTCRTSSINNAEKVRGCRNSSLEFRTKFLISHTIILFEIC